MTHFRRIAADGAAEPVERMLASEHPVAIEINGIGYAVMMASAADLTDFVIGFLLGERLVAQADEIVEIDIHAAPGGSVARVRVAPERAAAIAGTRHRLTDSACGLCGIEAIERVHRALPAAPTARALPDAIFRALATMRDHQPINAQTGAAHAAMACAADGGIRLAREDVGRHNAFDKLIGAMALQRLTWDGGFALLSSRCSYELVEKAALSACPMLVTVSAATDLAVMRAEKAGLTLVSLARSDAILVTEG